MMGTNKKRYDRLMAEYDENLEAVLIYGKNKRTLREELISWNQSKDNGNGREDLYMLKSILTGKQITWMEGIYAEFEDNGEKFFLDPDGNPLSVYYIKGEQIKQERLPF